MKKKKIYIAGIIALICIIVFGYHKYNSGITKKYDTTTDVLIKSSGWEIVSEVEKYTFTIENFDGEWISAQGSNYNIAGFEDNLSCEYSYVAGEWITENKSDEVVTYKVEVIDSYNVLPGNMHLICTIAYYDGQVCMARVYPVWENLGKVEEIINNRSDNEQYVVSWPINEERNIVKRDIEKINSMLSD